MHTLLSNSIQYWDAVALPAGDLRFEGPIARVSILLNKQPERLFFFLNDILRSTGIPQLSHPRFFKKIPSVIVDEIQNDLISINYSGITNSRISYVASLLKLEKVHLKSYLLALSQYGSKRRFKKYLNLFIKGILKKLDALSRVENLDSDIKDLLALYYFEGFLEITLLFDSDIFETEYIDILFRFLDNALLLLHWVDYVELTYSCEDYINKVKNFIQAENSFSKPLVSDNVMNIVNDTINVDLEAGATLYNRLVDFYLMSNIKKCDRLITAIGVLESYLYVKLSGNSIDGNDLYEVFSNRAKTRSAANGLRDKCYAGIHLEQDTARGAYETILDVLNHKCFSFLRDEKIVGIVSIPRVLEVYLQKMLKKYSNIFSENIKAVMKDKNGKYAGKAYLKYPAKLCAEITKEMNNLVKGGLYDWILESEDDLENLKYYFREFCRSGRPLSLQDSEKLKVKPKRKEILYGFFLKFMGTFQDNASDVYDFLKETLNDFTMGKISFVRNATSHVRKYEEHVNHRF